MTKQKKLLNVQQVADRLGISVRSVYRLVSEGQFASLKIGSSLRILEKSIDDYIDRRILIHGLENGISLESVPGDDTL